MTEAYTKSYVGIKDIMRLFNVGYSKARIIFDGAQKLHSKNYSSLENQVVLQKVLESQGISDFDFWSKQQEKKLKTSRTKTRR